MVEDDLELRCAAQDTEGYDSGYMRKTRALYGCALATSWRFEIARVVYVQIDVIAVDCSRHFQAKRLGSTTAARSVIRTLAGNDRSTTPPRTETAGHSCAARTSGMNTNFATPKPGIFHNN